MDRLELTESWRTVGHKLARVDWTEEGKYGACLHVAITAATTTQSRQLSLLLPFFRPFLLSDMFFNTKIQIAETTSNTCKHKKKCIYVNNLQITKRED